MTRILARLKAGAVLAVALTGLGLPAWAQQPTYLFYTQGSDNAALDILRYQGLNIVAGPTDLATGDANFNQPSDLVIDPVNRWVYVADEYESSGGIVRFNLDGTGRTVVVAPTAGATYNGLALDVAQQRLYFTQGSATPALDALKVVNLSNSFVSTIVSGAANFQQPTDLAFDPNLMRIYVADEFESTGAILRFEFNGSGRTVLVPGVSGSTYGGLALNRAQQQLFFTQGSATPALDALKVVNLTNLNVTTLASGAANFQQPSDVVYDATTQWLYVADEFESTGPILRFDANGTNRTQTVAPASGASYGGVALFTGASPDLVVSTPQTIPAGEYRDITITGTGIGTLGGGVTVTGTFQVQSGGVFSGGGSCGVISGPGTFSLDAGATMNICHAQGIALTGATGQVQVTGTRTYSSGANYVYDGTAPQITGLGLPATVQNLTISNTAGVSQSQGLSVREVLTFTGTGNLTTGGNSLTLLSDATGTAMAVHQSTGNVVGAATVQRYITPGSAPGLGYRHMSTPVSNTTFADLATGSFTPVVNPAYNATINNGQTTPYPTVLGYNEALYPTLSTFSRGYFSPNALADPMVVGRGYTVYKDPSMSDFVGTLNNGNVTMTGLTKTGNFNSGTQKSGWHLLGNPFPSPLDWDLIAIPPGLSNSVSVYQSTGGQNGLYLTRAGGVGTLTGGMIPMAQGFFVRVLSGAPLSFTLPNAARATTYTNPSHFRTAPDTRPLVALTLHAVGAPAVETDEAIVYFPADATAGIDAAFDGAKPGHNVGVPTIVSLAADEELAINALPAATLRKGVVVPLLLDLPQAGRYELTLAQLANLAADQEVALLDRLTNTRFPLTAQSTITVAAAKAGEDRRFALIIGAAARVQPVAETSAAELALYPNPAHESVQVRVNSTSAVQLLDLTGRIVRTAVPQDGAVTFAVSGLRPGLYMVRAGSLTQRLVVE